MRPAPQQMEIPFSDAADHDASAPSDFFPEREQAIRQLHETFGVMVGERVRVTLRGLPGTFTGKLVLDALLLPESLRDAIPLRLNRITFDLRDIETCERLV